MSIPKIFRNITFRQLEIYDRLVKNGNFTSTARELYLTQPTISFQMKKLEETFGTPLFEISNRQLRLTATGHLLHEICGEIFSSLQRLQANQAVAGSRGRRDLFLAGVSTTEYFIPQIFKEFKAIHPEICFLLNICDRESLLRRLGEKRDELYLVDQLPGGLDIASIPFVDNPLVVVASPNHRLAACENISLSEISKENLLLREPGSGTRIALKRFFDRMGLDISVDMEFSSNEAIKRSVMNEMGISILSMHAVSREFRIGELVPLDVRGFPLVEKWYIVYAKSKPLSPGATAFLDFLVDKGRSILEQSLLCQPCGK